MLFWGERLSGGQRWNSSVGEQLVAFLIRVSRRLVSWNAVSVASDENRNEGRLRLETRSWKDVCSGGGGGQSVWRGAVTPTPNVQTTGGHECLETPSWDARVRIYWWTVCAAGLKIFISASFSSSSRMPSSSSAERQTVRQSAAPAHTWAANTWDLRQSEAQVELHLILLWNMNKSNFMRKKSKRKRFKITKKHAGRPKQILKMIYFNKMWGVKQSLNYTTTKNKRHYTWTEKAAFLSSGFCSCINGWRLPGVLFLRWSWC